MLTMYGPNINILCASDQDPAKLVAEYRPHIQGAYVDGATGNVIFWCDGFTLTFHCKDGADDKREFTTPIVLAGGGLYRSALAVPEEIINSSTTRKSYLIEWPKIANVTLGIIETQPDRSQQPICRPVN